MSDIVNRLSVLNGEHYGSFKSQKGIAKRKPVSGKNDGRGDFDGTSAFIPFADDAQAALYTEIVLGTRVTANLLSYLLFNRYQMATPAYRETKHRLADMDWKTCRQNLANWAESKPASRLVSRSGITSERC